MPVKATSPEITALKVEIEKHIGYKISSRSDFMLLASEIKGVTHEHIAENTLRRLWGAIKGYDSVFTRTLDVLCKYIGYGHWNEFCYALKQSSGKESDMINSMYSIRTEDCRIQIKSLPPFQIKSLPGYKRKKDNTECPYAYKKTSRFRTKQYFITILKGRIALVSTHSGVVNFLTRNGKLFNWIIQYIDLGSDVGIQKGQKFIVYAIVDVAGETSEKEIGTLTAQEVMSGSRTLCKVNEAGDVIAKNLITNNPMSIKTRAKSEFSNFLNDLVKF